MKKTVKGDFMRLRVGFLALAFAVCGTAAAQDIFYHCVKNGRKLVSDQPCADFQAKETKRVYANEMPPINGMDSVTENQKRRGQAVTDRINQEAQERQAAQVNEEARRREKDAYCAALWEEKRDVTARQRRHSSDALNTWHLDVNNRIYQAGCGQP